MKSIVLAICLLLTLLTIKSTESFPLGIYEFFLFRTEKTTWIFDNLF